MKSKQVVSNLVHHGVIFDESTKEETVKQKRAFELKIASKQSRLLLRLDNDFPEPEMQKRCIGQRIRIRDFEKFVQVMSFRVLISPIQTLLYVLEMVL